MKEWFSHHPGGRFAICETPNIPIDTDLVKEAWYKTTAGSRWANMRGYHVLRHSFASICAMRGVPEATISRWMGHENAETKARYRHLFPEQSRAEMGRLFA